MFIFAFSLYLQWIRVKFVYEGHRIKVKVTGAKKVENAYSRNVKLRVAITPALFKTACLVHQLLASTAPTLLNVPVCRHFTHLRAWSSTSSFIFSQNTGCSTDAHQLRGQKFRCWDRTCGTLCRLRCCPLSYQSSTRRGISASILTVKCRWTCTLPLSAVAATISYDNSVP